MIVIDQCPLNLTGDATDLLFWAELARKGTWPMSGGALDQSYRFLHECRLIWSEREMWRAKLMPFGNVDE